MCNDSAPHAHVDAESTAAIRANTGHLKPSTTARRPQVRSFANPARLYPLIIRWNRCCSCSPRWAPRHRNLHGKIRVANRTSSKSYRGAAHLVRVPAPLCTYNDIPTLAPLPKSIQTIAKSDLLGSRTNTDTDDEQLFRRGRLVRDGVHAGPVVVRATVRGCRQCDRLVAISIRSQGTDGIGPNLGVGCGDRPICRVAQCRGGGEVGTLIANRRGQRECRTYVGLAAVNRGAIDYQIRAKCAQKACPPPGPAGRIP